MSDAPWNTTETARLRVLALARLKLSEIATKMERSRLAFTSGRKSSI
jgi:Tc3 transposase